MEPGILREHSPSAVNSDTISKHGTELPEVQDSNYPQKPVFFNYHEFSETYYIDLSLPCNQIEHSEAYGLCITHFPNIYAPMGSKVFEDTRIVRIPRRYETTLEYPDFSTCLPGLEPAALINEQEGRTRFVPHGIFDNRELFGYSSVSPLSDFFTETEFEEIITSINENMCKASRIYSWFNLLTLVADMLTLGLWHWLSARYITPDPMQEVEDHIAKLNELPAFKKRNIKILSPRRSGYLSVCA